MNRYVKLGLVIIPMLSAGCAFKATDMKHYYNRSEKGPFIMESHFTVPKDFRFTYRLPKKADTNKDGIIDNKEAKDYFAGFFKKFYE